MLDFGAAAKHSYFFDMHLKMTWWSASSTCSSTRKSVTSLGRPIRPALISGFRSMKRLGVFLLPPWMGCGVTPQHFPRYPFIHPGGERHPASKLSCPRTQHNVPGQVSLHAGGWMVEKTGIRNEVARRLESLNHLQMKLQRQDVLLS